MQRYAEKAGLATRGSYALLVGRKPVDGGD